MTRPLRIVTLPGAGAALAAALAGMTGRIAQECEVVELEVKEPEPMPPLALLHLAADLPPMKPPASRGPQRTRKGKPARW